MKVWVSETLRSDGLYVRADADFSWSIRTPGGGMAIGQCPCCDRPYLSADAARRAADFLFAEPSDVVDLAA